MTVEELINILRTCDPEDDVLISYADKGKSSTAYSLREVDLVVFSNKRYSVVLSDFDNLSPELKGEPRIHERD